MVGDSGESLADLLDRVAAGDKRAFEEVYRVTSMKLFRVCLRILPSKAEAEEALQDVYLRIWHKAGSFDRSRGSPMAWLIAMTRNRAIDTVRAAANVSAGPLNQSEAVADPGEGPFDTFQALDDGRRLAACMETLAETDAGFVRTAFFDGYTYAELAARDNLPIGTVKSRIRRALLKLRECLG